MLNHLSALGQIFLLTSIMMITYAGWGELVARVLGLKDRWGGFDVILIWFGWSITITIFIILHFFFPITIWVVIPVFALGVVLAIPQIGAVFRSWPAKNLERVLLSGLVIVIFLVAVLVFSKAMLPPAHYDTGLYYFNAIRWINAYPTVVGLVNLHGRLGYNIAYFPYVASLNFFPLWGHGRSLANGFLYVLTIVSLFQYLRPAITRPSLLLIAHPLKYLPILFGFPMLVYIGLMTDGFYAPVVDLAITLIQINLFVIFAQLMADWSTDAAIAPGKVVLLLILAVVSVTIKLSSAAFSGTLVAMVTLAYFFKTNRLHNRVVIRILALLSLVVIAWAVRGYALSGAPLYPATIGRLPFPWSVSDQMAEKEMVSIRGWARQRTSDSGAVLSNWNWFSPWFASVRERYFVDVYAPSILGCGLTILAAIAGVIGRKTARKSRLYWLLIPPLLLSLIYWFFTAPDPRFAGALFWVFLISAALLLLNEIQRFASKWVFAAVLGLVFLIANLHIAAGTSYYITHIAPVKKDISVSGWHPDIVNAVVEQNTRWGVKVLTPVSGDMCWDSPIPCTPYFNENLSLQEAGKLETGFIIKAPSK